MSDEVQALVEVIYRHSNVILEALWVLAIISGFAFVLTIVLTVFLYRSETTKEKQ